MKDGYYLSAYADISELEHLLCTVARHDNCFALWRKVGQQVELVHYWELERLTGIKKHALSFFDVAQCKSVIERLLLPFGLTVNDIVEIWGIPELQKDNTYLQLDCFKDYSYHSIFHVFSSMMADTNLSRKEKILAISVDGGSDIVMNKAYDLKENEERNKHQFVGVFSDRKNNIVRPFPVYSPAQIWMALSFHYNMQEGSLMALATASRSELYLEVEDIWFGSRISTKQQDINFRKIMDLVSYVNSLTEEDTGIKFSGFDSRFTEEENRISMVMKIVQAMSQRIMERNIEKAIEEFAINPEETYLCMSGGFALNCPCNAHLMKKYKFKGFCSVPCVSDTGMALGIGLYAFYKKMDGNFNFRLENAYYGDADNADAFLAQGEYDEYIAEINEFDPDQAAEDIQSGLVIWFEGKAEIGPRALGARSILGDPRTKGTKDRLNTVKQRQWWRPVAPIIMEEYVSQWFQDSYASPYMLHTFILSQDKVGRVPAITHHDNSARVQTMGRNSGKLREVLEAFFRQTEVPILCNTSLNDKGEPIINTIREAMNFALRKNIEIMYINGKRLVLKNHTNYTIDKPLKRSWDIRVWKNEYERQALLFKYNPNNIPEDELWVIVHYCLYNFVREKIYDRVSARKLILRAKQMIEYIETNAIRKDEKKTYYNIYKNMISGRNDYE